MTERARFVFKVKAYESGQPWIYLETLDEDLQVLGAGCLGLDLPKGTTLDKATEVAMFLGTNISAVSYTRS